MQVGRRSYYWRQLECQTAFPEASPVVFLDVQQHYCFLMQRYSSATVRDLSQVTVPVAQQ